MYGLLTLNGTEIKELNIATINDYIKLDNISKIEFKKSEYGKDFFDVLTAEYRKQINEYNDISELKNLIDEGKEELDVEKTAIEGNLRLFGIRLKTLFNKNDDESKTLSKLIELGASQTDIAIMRNNENELKTIKDRDNKKINIYELAKEFRLFDVAKSVYNEKFHLEIDPRKCTNIHTEPDIQYNDNAENLAIIIENDGAKTWDHTNSLHEYNSFKNLFKATIGLGSGSVRIGKEDIKTTLSFAKENFTNTNFTFVKINSHGSKSGELLISEFPAIGKKTMYFVSSCYGGRYHENTKLDENVTLVSGCKKDETNLFTPFDIQKFNQSSNQDLDLYTKLLQYYSSINDNTLLKPTPHISLDSMNYCPLKGFLKDNIENSSVDNQEQNNANQTHNIIENLDNLNLVHNPVDIVGDLLDNNSPYA